MSKHIKPSFSVNSGGPTSNEGGAFFNHCSFSAKTSYANQKFTTHGLAGPTVGIPLDIDFSSGAVTSDFLVLVGGGCVNWIIADGTTTYNRLQLIYTAVSTNVSGLLTGYVTAGTSWPNSGNADITVNFVRLGSILTTSGTAGGVKYEDSAIDFTPANGELFCFGVLNDSGGTIAGPMSGTMTLSTNSNLN